MVGTGAWPKTIRSIIPCPKCGRKNARIGSIEDLVFFKCDCGKILINKILGVVSINKKIFKG
ncbi:MAG TPA: hypothetical protein VMV95_03695 [Bacillota bacterium]|nr:hypothetical protein [Bacillota bacterium]